MTDDIPGMEDVLILLGTTPYCRASELQVQGNYTEALGVLTELVEMINGVKETVGDSILDQFGSDLILALNQRGIVYRMLQQYGEASDDFNAAFGIAHDSNDLVQCSQAKTNLADVLRVGERNFPQAHQSLTEAIAFAEYGSLEHAKAVDQQGLVFVGEEQYPNAVEAYKQAIVICEALVHQEPGNKESLNRLAQVNHHLGVAYTHIDDPSQLDDAYELQKRALGFFQGLEDQQGIVNTVITMGRIAEVRDDTEEALVQFEQAETILQQTGYKRAITCLALDMANIYLRLDRGSEAMHYLQTFTGGVNEGHITEHDRGLLKEKYNTVVDTLTPEDNVFKSAPGFMELEPLFE